MSTFYEDGFIVDLSPEQRYVIERLNGDWAIRDRCADGDFLYTHPVQAIETWNEAQELRRRLIRGESLMD